MSYIALATDRFDEVVRFYGTDLGFPVVEQWDRPTARGLRFDLGGMRLEILDNERERNPLTLGAPADRTRPRRPTGRGRDTFSAWTRWRGPYFRGRTRP